MAVGDYERIESDRRAAYKRMMRSPWGSEEHEELTRRHDDLADRRAAYLRDLLSRLPFRWHIAHAYTPRETATYGGADHIVVDDPVRVGRDPGDALSRPRAKFWELSRVVGEDRLPTSIADIKIAERIIAAPIAEKPKKPKKTAKQLDHEIAEAIDRMERD